MDKVGGDNPGRFHAAADARGAARQRSVAPTDEEYRLSLDSEGGGSYVQFVSFFLGTDEYAFELFDAVEVLRPRRLTEVPRCPPYIKGIISVRGELIPVIDLKMRLGILPKPDDGASESARMLISGMDDVRAAFVIDAMGGVKEAPETAVRDASGQWGASFMKGILRSGGSSVYLLDLAKLIEEAH